MDIFICPICRESANQQMQFLPCAHPMHAHCYRAFIAHGLYDCPICKHPIGGGFGEPEVINLITDDEDSEEEDMYDVWSEEEEDDDDDDDEEDADWLPGCE